jgi:gamma-glutamylcyclotransferase (GGCT)/AIG2-like uncharacterized protein YtfP
MHQVFVYGTLRKGDSRFGILAECECIAEEAHLLGFKMLHLGGFPGIVPSENGAEDQVRGEIYEVDDALLAQLDRIEGYQKDDPESSLYLRQEVTPSFAEGEGEFQYFPNTWTYILNEDGWSHSTRVIASGDWFDRDGVSERSAE